MHLEQSLDVRLGVLGYQLCSFALPGQKLTHHRLSLGALSPRRRGRHDLLDCGASRKLDVLLELLAEGLETVRDTHEETVHPGQIYRISLFRASQRSRKLTIVLVGIEKRLELVDDNVRVGSNERLLAGLLELRELAVAHGHSVRVVQLTSFLVVSFKYKLTRSASS